MTAKDRAKAEARKRARNAVAMAAVRAEERLHLFGEDGKNGYPRGEDLRSFLMIFRHFISDNEPVRIRRFEFDSMRVECDLKRRIHVT